MSDQRSSTWPIISGVLALLTVISCAYAIDQYLTLQKVLAGEENMRRRWHADTEGIAEEMKQVGRKISEESYARVKAEAQVAALQAQIADLTKQLTEAQRSAKPSP
jgi:septal ring factor EnvC (AmiA/AmiB activator)